MTGQTFTSPFSPEKVEGPGNETFLPQGGISTAHTLEEGNPVLLMLTSMIGLGLIAGFLARGTLAGLKEIHFKLIWLLFVALIVAILPLFSDAINKHRRVLLLGAMAGVLVFLIVNILTIRGEMRAGMLVITLGWALNFTVIALNRGMPLSRWAYARSGQTEAITQGTGGFYRAVVAGPRTKLRALGDVIPVRIFHQVVSIGDIFLMLGIAFVIAAAMRTIRRGASAEQPAQ